LRVVWLMQEVVLGQVVEGEPVRFALSQRRAAKYP
jgi:hypothetical protein